MAGYIASPFFASFHTWGQLGEALCAWAGIDVCEAFLTATYILPITERTTKHCLSNWMFTLDGLADGDIFLANVTTLIMQNLFRPIPLCLGRFYLFRTKMTWSMLGGILKSIQTQRKWTSSVTKLIYSNIYCIFLQKFSTCKNEMLYMFYRPVHVVSSQG